MTKNKSHKKKSLGWYLDLALNLILLFFGLVLVWILLQVTCIATFKIPSDSMEPALLGATLGQYRIQGNEILCEALCCFAR